MIVPLNGGKCVATSKQKRLYLIPTVSKTFDIMELLQAEKTPMSLENIYNRTQICKTSVYRILQTMLHRGYATRGEDGLYRSASSPRKMRFGYGSQSVDMPFSESVKSSLLSAAGSSGVELVILDNRYDAATALRNAEEFVKGNVELIIEFQIDQHAAPLIADRIAKAGIPLIAVDIPHPHATYFGVDNFRVGLEAGTLLAEHAVEYWGGRVDSVLGLDIEEAGALVQSRITGSFEGIRTVLRDIEPGIFSRVDSRGLREKSRRITADFLSRRPSDRHILIAASTDSGALGALEAARELGRTDDVVIVGQDCISEVVEEMQDPASPIIGSVSHEASTYGPRLIELGISLLQGRSVPPYNYVNHKLVKRTARPSSGRPPAAKAVTTSSRRKSTNLVAANR